MTEVFQPILENERLRLNAVEDKDIDIIHEWYQDTVFLKRLHGMPPKPMYHKEMTEFVNYSRESKRDYYFGMRPKDMDVDLVGQICLMRVDGVHQTAGMWLGIPAQYQGRGYGGTAISLILDFAFNEINLHRVWLFVFGFNTPAIGLYEKLGFQHEGRLRESAFRDGQYWDAFLMGILRHEWRQSQAT